MIIGNGMLANAFMDDYEYDKNIYIFASGVSNSQEVENQAFLREQELLENTLNKIDEETFIYFSTCSISQENEASLYIRHKLRMENIIKNSGVAYHIFRLPQVAGQTDKKNFFINYIFSKIVNGEVFEVWSDSTRNVIDVDDVFKITHYIIQNRLFMNEVVNIATPYNVSVIEYVKQIEKLVSKKANYSIIKRGSQQQIDISTILPLIKEVDVDFLTQETYLNKIIKKYYLDL